MGRVRCNYCGSFIDDSLPNCPHCGAVNDNMVRFAQATPKTIAELQSWYQARNLPPEDVTRFYIGKNVRHARAFGIYEKDGKYIVYKNKSDGTRAIRYEGKDEAYAVNEIYMKLKEEILNQKNRNLTNSKQPSRSPQHKYQAGRSISFLSTKLGRIFIVIMALGFLSAVFQDEPLSSGYYTKGDPAATYYLYNGYGTEWWKYDTSTEVWNYYDTYNTDVLPSGIESGDYLSYQDMTVKTGTDICECPTSQEFIDRHHPVARQGYYILNNSLYYFLDNRYGDNSGWYTYDNGDWNFYSTGDDKDELGEDLWYNADNYYSSTSYSGLSSDQKYYYEDNENWNADFSDTSYYETYEQDRSDFNTSHDTSSDSDSSWDWSSWDNDSSWDWDSGSDWDSGWSDWDSDW